MRVHRIPFSTNVERVELALGHKGVAVEWVDVDPADRAPVRELTGQDLVPVLEDDDARVVVDSMEIVRHLERRHPDPPLYPRAPARRAEVDVFVEWFNLVWKVPPNAIEAELGAERPDRAEVERLGARMTGWLDVFESLLDGREYLTGEFSAADVAAWPFLRYALLPPAAGDDQLFHEILARYQPLGDDHPRLAEWIRRVDERPRG